VGKHYLTVSSKSELETKEILRRNHDSLKLAFSRAQDSRRRRPPSSISLSQLAFSDTSSLPDDGDSTISSTCFDFDSSVINSRVYRQAMMNQLQEAYIGDHNDVPQVVDNDLEKASPPLGHEQETEPYQQKDVPTPNLLSSSPGGTQISQLGPEATKVATIDDNRRIAQSGSVLTRNKASPATTATLDLEIKDEILVIGIDFGTTFTGMYPCFPECTIEGIPYSSICYPAVAYSTTKYPRPHVIQRWPGINNNIENLVPTTLAYRNDILVAWGHLCSNFEDGCGVQTHQLFKNLLDPRLQAFNIQPGVPRVEIQDVKLWCTDFLRQLHQYIKEFISGIPGMSSVWEGTVEFVFSVPTTWEKQGMAEDLKDIALDAGFGSGSREHSVGVLTEAKATTMCTLGSDTILGGDIASLGVS
jgi:hypothetical protein